MKCAKEILEIKKEVEQVILQESIEEAKKVAAQITENFADNVRAGDFSLTYDFYILHETDKSPFCYKVCFKKSRYDGYYSTKIHFETLLANLAALHYDIKVEMTSEIHCDMQMQRITISVPSSLPCD